MIILGDQHREGKATSDDVDRARFGNEVVNALAKDGDWVLLEGRSYDPSSPLPHNAEIERIGIRKEINRTGWEEMDLFDRALKLKSKFSEMMNRYASSPDFDPRRDPKSTNLGRELFATFDEINEVTVKLRNQQMLAYIVDTSKKNEDKKIFVFAGTNHVHEIGLLNNLRASKIPFIVLAAGKDQ